MIKASTSLCMIDYKNGACSGSCALFTLLGPFYGAIAVPSVTRCRCRRRRRRRGHRCAGGVRRDSSDTW